MIYDLLSGCEIQLHVHVDFLMSMKTIECIYLINNYHLKYIMTVSSLAREIFSRLGISKFMKIKNQKTVIYKSITGVVCKHSVMCFI